MFLLFFPTIVHLSSFFCFFNPNEKLEHWKGPIRLLVSSLQSRCVWWSSSRPGAWFSQWTGSYSGWVNEVLDRIVPLTFEFHLNLTVHLMSTRFSSRTYVNWRYTDHQNLTVRLMSTGFSNRTKANWRYTDHQNHWTKIHSNIDKQSSS